MTPDYDDAADLTIDEQVVLIEFGNASRLNDLLYDAIEANLPDDVPAGDATTDALFVVLGNRALVLAALDEYAPKPEDET